MDVLLGDDKGKGETKIRTNVERGVSNVDTNGRRTAGRMRIPVGWTRGEGNVKQVNLSLSEEADERLDIEAIGAKTTRAVIVDALICRHLRRYQLHDRGGSSEAEADIRTRVASAGEGTGS
jgi:hypothetical protein